MRRIKVVRIVIIIIEKIIINYFMVFTENSRTSANQRNCRFTIYFYKGVKRRKYLFSQYTD